MSARRLGHERGIFDFDMIRKRSSAARPATAAVILVASGWYGAAGVIVVIAFYAAHLGPGLGVHLHAPGAVLVLAAVGAVLSLYVWHYCGGARPSRSSSRR